MILRSSTPCSVFASVMIWMMSVGCAFSQEAAELFESGDLNWLLPDRQIQTESEGRPLETDRDSFTPAVTTVDAGRMLFESSYEFVKNRGVPNTNSFPQSVARVGVTDRLELRLGWNFEVGGGGSVSNDDIGGELEDPGMKRESQALYGFKYAVNQQRSWLPQSAVVVEGTSPTTGPSNVGGVQLTYVLGWKLPNDWQLCSAMRSVSTDEQGDHFNEWAPSVVLSAPVSDKWNAHVEYFGIFTNGRADETNAQYFSPGLHYSVSPDFEIGLRVGWGLNQDAASDFLNVGSGIRF
jgi:hypothetical protein